MSTRAIERHSSISLVTMLIVTFVGYLATFYFAHALGPSILGGYFLFLAYYGIFDLVGDGGFGGAAVKRISEGSEKDAFFSAFLALRIILLSGAVVVLFLAQPYLVDITGAGLFVPLILAILTGSLYSVTYAGVYGQGRVGIAKAGELISFFGRSLIQVIAVFLGYGLGGLLGGFIVGMITGGLLYLRFTNLLLVRFSRRHVKSLLMFSFWIFLTAGGNLIFSISDVVLIGYFLTNADVGIYRTTLQLTSVATFTTIALQTALYPQLSRWSAREEMSLIQMSISRAFTYSLFLAIPVATGGWLLGDRLLYYLYGDAFRAGGTALYVLLAMQVVNVFMYLQITSLNALDHPRDSFRVTTISAVMNVILNIGLIPVLGIFGAAIATTLAMGVNAFLSYLFLRRIVPVRVEHRSIRNILIASLIMGLAVLLLRTLISITSIVILVGFVAIGAGVYFTSLFSLDSEMYREIRNLVRSFGGPWPHWLDRYFT
ncbi:MAG: flippase [Methanomicrobiales archaeon]|nr:flippase [Methanomicrobiales archaeon]